MNKIIITGATSMLGAALTEVAIKNDTEIYAIIRPNTGRRNRLIESNMVHYVNGSLESLKTIEGLPNDCDTFYHFAWAGTEKAARDDPQKQELNIKYTLDAVKLAVDCGCSRFIGAGSQAEYGPTNEVIDNNTKHKPNTAYGVAKYAAGILSKKLCEEYKIDHIWARVFSVYGPRDNKGSMINYALSCWNKGECAYFSSGEQYWNYLYESDAGEMFFRLGGKDVVSGTYLIANPESRPLKEYLSILIDTYGSGAKSVFDASSVTPSSGLKADVERTITSINYCPKVSFEDGIKAIINEERLI